MQKNLFNSISFPTGLLCLFVLLSGGLFGQGFQSFSPEIRVKDPNTATVITSDYSPSETANIAVGGKANTGPIEAVRKGSFAVTYDDVTLLLGDNGQTTVDCSDPAGSGSPSCVPITEPISIMKN